MARLLKTAYPLPEIDYINYWVDGKKNEDWSKAHEAAFQELLDRSNALPDGEIVGALLRWPQCDGYAYYVVVKDSPLTLQWVPFLDGWEVSPALIRGLRRADVLSMVDRERRLNALFTRS